MGTSDVIVYGVMLLLLLSNICNSASNSCPKFSVFFWAVSRATSGKTKSQNTLGMRLAMGFVGCAIELEFVCIKNSYSYNDKTDLSVERLLSSSGKGTGSTTVFVVVVVVCFLFQLISPILSPYILSTSFIAMSSL